MSKKLKELQEERALKVAEMRSLNDKAGEEKRDLTEDEKSQWDELDGEVRSLDKDIEREQRMVELGGKKAKIKKKEEEERSEEDLKKEAEKREELFMKFCREGKDSLSEEERMLITPSKDFLEKRGLTKYVANKGGVLVPPGFAKSLIEAMIDMGGIRPIAHVIKTATGNTINHPTLNDAGEKGELLGEAVDRKATEDDKELFDSLPVSAYVYSSKSVKVDNELLQDDVYGLEKILARILSARIANITNEHFTTGDGTKKPKGVIIAAPVGAIAAALDGLTYDDFVDLEHSVNSVYRKGAHYMFNDNTLKVLKKLKNANGDLMWVDNSKVGAPNTFNGYPYQINDEMPDIGANAKSISFGNHLAYLIRDVDGAVLIRQDELYSNEFKTGFVMFSRHDGQLMDGGTHPVKVLKHPAL